MLMIILPLNQTLEKDVEHLTSSQLYFDPLQKGSQLLWTR